MLRGGLLNQSLTLRSASSRSDGLVRALDTRSINRPELFTSKLVIIHDLPDRLDNPLDSDAICKTQARPPVDRDKGELAIRSSELSPLQPKIAAADRTDPPDRLSGSVDSKALCNTSFYTRPPVDRDKGEFAIRSSELSPLQPGIAAADRTDPPDRLSGSVDSKAFAAPVPMQGLQLSETRATLGVWTLSDFKYHSSSPQLVQLTPRTCWS